MTTPLVSSSAAGVKKTNRMAPTWEELRKEARNLENEIDYKLIAFSKVAASLKDDEYSFSTDKDALMGSTNKKLVEIDF